jgi:hypothetical protein
MARFSSVVRANCIALPVMFASGIEAAAEIVETGTSRSLKNPLALAL